MESALTPREIQTRMRAGASLEEVAEAAGVPTSQIEAFGAPVIAERNHVVGTALQNPIRRAGQTSSGRSLRQLVETGLASQNVDFDQVKWDSWKDQDKLWTVQAKWEENNEALFHYDIRARFSVAVNETAKDLVDDHGVAALSPTIPSDPDNEPTVDLNDEWALARSTAGEDTSFLRRIHGKTSNQNDQLSDFDSASLESDSYEGVELQEVDGEYALLPSDENQVDVLLDMLQTISEDSVKIFEGLDAAVSGNEAPPARPGNSHSTGQQTHFLQSGQTQYGSQPDDSENSGFSIQSEPPSSAGVSQQDDSPASSPDSTDTQAANFDASSNIQDPLVEVEQPDQPKKTRRRKRAAVPSWDEIMFGGPLPKKKKPQS